MFSETGVRFDRETNAALDARINGFSGGFDVVGVTDDPNVDSSDRGDPLLFPDSLDETLTLPNPFTKLLLPPSPLLPSPSLALARATILALMLASRAASVAGSYPSHSLSCVAE